MNVFFVIEYFQLSFLTDNTITFRIRSILSSYYVGVESENGNSNAAASEPFIRRSHANFITCSK